MGTMPWKLHIIRASDFVRLDASERLDLEASKELLRAVAKACLKRGLSSSIIDLRSLPEVPQPQFTVNQIHSLVCEFADSGFDCGQRLVILCASDVHGGAKKFAFISRMRGLKVKVFTGFEQAIAWLSREEDASMADSQPAITSQEDEEEARRIRILHQSTALRYESARARERSRKSVD
jgi:hypothetical protein